MKTTKYSIKLQFGYGDEIYIKYLKKSGKKIKDFSREKMYIQYGFPLLKPFLDEGLLIMVENVDEIDREEVKDWINKCANTRINRDDINICRKVLNDVLVFLEDEGYKDLQESYDNSVRERIIKDLENKIRK